jgi:hypothetical protein
MVRFPPATTKIFQIVMPSCGVHPAVTCDIYSCEITDERTDDTVDWLPFLLVLRRSRFSVIILEGFRDFSQSVYIKPGLYPMLGHARLPFHNFVAVDSVAAIFRVWRTLGLSAD